MALLRRRTLYIAARLLIQPARGGVANEMRRDGHKAANDNRASRVAFDTFYDHRNGFFFQTTRSAAARQVVHRRGRAESRLEHGLGLRGGAYDGGWMAEMVIPFKSLRYPGSGPQVWGINIRRVVAGRTNTSISDPIPRPFGARGIYSCRGRHAGGLEAPPAALTSS